MEMEKLFEHIYNETHVRLREMTSKTVADIIQSAIDKDKKNIAISAITFAKKFIRLPYTSTLQTDTRVSDEYNVEHFSPNLESADLNTKLAETFCVDVSKQFDSANQQYVRTWFEAFYTELKKFGIPFGTFTNLHVA